MAIYLLVIIGLTAVIALCNKLYLRVESTRPENYDYLQLILGADYDFDDYLAGELIKKLHELALPRSLLSGFFVQPKNPSLFIDSSPGQRLRLILAVPPKEREAITSEINALGPNIEAAQIDYASDFIGQTVSYKLKRHFSYPLKTEFKYGEVDPLTSLASKLAKSGGLQRAVVTLSLRPYNSLRVKRLRDNILTGQLPNLRSSPLTRLLAGVFRALVRILKAVTWVIGQISSSTSRPVRSKHKVYDINIDDPKVIAQLDKLYEPLFKTKVDLKLNGTASERRRLIKDIDVSLSGFKSPGRQRLVTSRLGSWLDSHCHSYLTSPFSNSSILSVSEIAGFYHLPAIQNLGTIYQINHFKSLPASQEVTSSDLVLGVNHYQGVDHQVGITNTSREKHVYIAGSTGSGKSNLMAQMMIQDLESGKGLSLIDPHGDLAETVLAQVPESRLKDVIYFNPIDINYPIGLNLLELKTFASSPGRKQEVDRITESVVSLFRKLFSEDGSGGHRVEYIIRNAVQTALTVNDRTIFTVYKILTDNDFRQKVVSRLKDQNLINFWQSELNKAGDYQRIKMTAGVTSKIGRLLFSEPAKRVFGQPNSTIDLSDVLDSRKILICNFSKGELGEDGSRLFGLITLTKLQLAALGRSSQPESRRRDHYLYVDEFQNLATTALTQILSEARKYHLYLTMAEQSPSQQDQKLTDVILANVGSLVVFRSPSPADERLLLPLFSPELTGGDLMNLPAYHFYLRSITDQLLPPVSGCSLPIEPTNDPSSQLEAVSQSRQNYGLDIGRLKSLKPQSGPQLKLL